MRPPSRQSVNWNATLQTLTSSIRKSSSIWISEIWVRIADMLFLLPWATFFGWILFFFNGTNWGAIPKSAPPLVFGALIAYLTTVLTSFIGVKVYFPSGYFLLSIILPLIILIILCLMILLSLERCWEWKSSLLHGINI